MSYFTQEDFKKHWERLTVIINHKINKPLLTPFKAHTDLQKKKFNKVLNEYLREIEFWIKKNKHDETNKKL